MLRKSLGLFIFGLGLQMLLVPIGWASMFEWQTSTLPAGSVVAFPTPAGGFRELHFELADQRRLRGQSCVFTMLHPPCRLTSYLDSRILWYSSTRTIDFKVTNRAMTPIDVRLKIVTHIPWTRMSLIAVALMILSGLIAKTF